MPDPLLYFKAIGAALIASTIVVLAMGRQRTLQGELRIRLAGILGLALALGIGYYVLLGRLAWPPANGLDRFLIIVLPIVVAIELSATLPRVQPWLIWTLRLVLAVLLGRILLHDSVYLSGLTSNGPLGEGGAIVLVIGVLTAAVWGLLARLSHTSPSVALPIALALAIQSSGIAIMLAGYLKGGAASFPLAAAIVGTAISSRVLIRRPNYGAMIGVGVVGLCSLLCIGRFFGGLSTGEAITMLLAPLLCWAAELPVVRNQKSWIVGTIQLTLVALPLLVVLYQAKQEFDRETAPLLVRRVDVFNSK